MKTINSVNKEISSFYEAITEQVELTAEYLLGFTQPMNTKLEDASRLIDVI